MDRIKEGYTLAEMLAVVLVLSIAASVAIPNLSASDPNKLELAAQEVAQAIRFARSEALRTGEPHGFQLRSATNRIRLFKPDISTSPWTPNFNVLHPISKKPYDLDLDEHRFARVESLTQNRIYRGACTTQDSVYFDGWGIPRCTNPEQVLLDVFEVEFTLAGHVRTLKVERLSGRVTVQ